MSTIPTQALPNQIPYGRNRFRVKQIAWNYRSETIFNGDKKYSYLNCTNLNVTDGKNNVGIADLQNGWLCLLILFDCLLSVQLNKLLILCKAAYCCYRLIRQQTGSCLIQCLSPFKTIKCIYEIHNHSRFGFHPCDAFCMRRCMKKLRNKIGIGNTHLKDKYPIMPDKEKSV